MVTDKRQTDRQKETAATDIDWTKDKEDDRRKTEQEILVAQTREGTGSQRYLSER